MLSTEQQVAQQAIINAVEQGLGAVCLPGASRTGRFTLLRETAEILEAKGKSCMFVAPTGKAAAVLRSRGGCNAQTIHSLLQGVAKGETPVQDMVVVEHDSAEILPKGSPRTEELYAALLEACKTLVIITEEKNLYEVVTEPVLEPKGLVVLRPLPMVFRQSPL